MTDATTTPGSHAGPELGAAASDLRMATFRLARRLRSERAVDAMSDGQFTALVALKVHGPHTLGELADRERVTAPSMTRTVGALEEAGYLTRTQSGDDKRKVTIELTAAGREVVEETARRRDAWLEGVLAGLPDDERAVLARGAAIMSKLAER